MGLVCDCHERMNSDLQIRSQQQQHCYLCGAIGQPLYADLRDRLYAAPGTWNLVRCARARCGLVWLDPMPLAQDMTSAYADYFTHDERDPQQHNRTYRRWLMLARPYALLLKLLGVSQSRARARLMYLDRLRSGYLLDVGCGDGG